MPKGSFYYFFASKQALTLAVIEDHWRDQRATWVATLRAGGSPLGRLQTLVSLTGDTQEESRRASGAMNGCLFANLALELSTQDEVVRERLEQIFGEQIELVLGVLTEAAEAGEIAPSGHRAAPRERWSRSQRAWCSSPSSPTTQRSCTKPGRRCNSYSVSMTRHGRRDESGTRAQPADRAARAAGADHPGTFRCGFSSIPLTVAVSNGGGLGSYGANTLAPDEITKLVAELRAQTHQPFNVNLWVPLPGEPELTVVEDEFNRHVDRLRP